MRIFALGMVGLVAACGHRADPCAEVTGCADDPASGPCADPPDGGGAAVLSPADGSTQRAPWLPLLVRADQGDAATEVTVCLDGVDVTDPAAIVRKRRSSWGGGWDYLAWLDLEGVAAGEHTLRVFTGRAAGLAGASTFTVDRSGHRVDVEVRDAQGAFVPARVLVTDADDVPVPVVALSAEADPSERDLEVHSLFAVDGRATVWLPPGGWRFRAIRGVLDTVPMAQVVLVDDAVVPLVVERAIDLPGVLSADLHVHTGRSYDSFVPDRARFESLAAAGLDVAVMTDHNEVVDPAVPMAQTLPEGAPLHGVTGIEHDLRRVGGTDQPNWDLGHMNAFPVLGPEAAPIPPLSADPIGAILGAWRERQVEAPYPGVGSEVVLQLNHPRGIHFFPEDDPIEEAWPLFGPTGLGFDRDLAPGEGSNAWMTEPDPATGATALDYDALEIVNRFSWPLYVEVRSDWFALMNAGWFLTGTGNSDSHALEVETAGLPVNLVAMEPPAAGESLDLGAFVTALRERRVIVSTGPVVELSVVSGAATATPGDTLTPDGPVTATLRVRAAPWVPVPEARLVVDGEVIERWTLAAPGAGEGVDATFTATIPPGAKWAIAEAGWPIEDAPEARLGAIYPLVAPGHRPIGFTNAVRFGQ